jgi:hypothetical protein
MAMLAASLKLGQSTPDWNLADPGLTAGEPRTFQWHVSFDHPFANVPVVHVGLTGFDIDNRDTARLEVGAVAISSDGFDLLLTTWRETRVYEVSISWLALGQ